MIKNDKNVVSVIAYLRSSFSHTTVNMLKIDLGNNINQFRIFYDFLFSWGCEESMWLIYICLYIRLGFFLYMSCLQSQAGYHPVLLFLLNFRSRPNINIFNLRTVVIRCALFTFLPEIFAIKHPICDHFIVYMNIHMYTYRDIHVCTYVYRCIYSKIYLVRILQIHTVVFVIISITINASKLKQCSCRPFFLGGQRCVTRRLQ